MKNILGVVFFTIFLDLLGFGMIIPVQPFYTEKFGASATVITLLGASYSLMQFLFAPLWGKLSDKAGRRIVILISTLIVAIGHFSFAFSESLMLLFVARMLSGLGSANIGAAQAIIADVTTSENRAKGMGLIGAAFGLGFLLGPALGGWLVQYQSHLPMVAAGILGLLNFGFAYFYLPETRKNIAKPYSEESLTQSNKARFWKQSNIFELMGISLLFTLGFAMMEQTIGLFIAKIWVAPDIDPELKIKQGAALTAQFLVVVGLVASMIQGGLISRLNRHFGEVWLCRIGLILTTLSIALIPWVGKLGVFSSLLFISFVMASGTGLSNPSRSSLLSKSVDSEIQGMAMGWSHALSALGRVIGPATAGYLFDQNIAYPFWAAAGFMLIPIYWSFRLKNIPASSINESVSI